MVELLLIVKSRNRNYKSFILYCLHLDNKLIQVKH